MLSRTQAFGNVTLLALVVLAAPGCRDQQERPQGARAGEPGSETVPDGALPPAERCESLASTLGSSGSALDGGVCKVTFPRDALSVELLGATLPPGMGLTSWAAFGPAGERGAIVMGDLALTPGELPRVLSGLLENGFRATAIHRHMLGEAPPMSFVHYLAVGPADSLASRLDRALDAAPSARGEAGPAPDEATRAVAGEVAGVPCSRIEEYLGAPEGSAATGPGYCKASLPRADLEVEVDGIPVPASMGVGSWFAFRETPDGSSVVVTGDLALTGDAVNPAVGVLRERGIEVVSLHNHMIGDDPKIYFFHFQARGSPGALARGLRAGLDAGLP